MNRLSEHLDESYAVEAEHQMETNVSSFLDYNCKRTVTIEQYIAGFHSRMDKIATLNLDRWKGNLLLHQESLTSQDNIMLLGVSHGSYYIYRLTVAIRNEFMNQ